jgi:hypothetical protein
VSDLATEDLRAASLALVALAADKPGDAVMLLGPCSPGALRRIAALGDALAQCANQVLNRDWADNLLVTDDPWWST